MTKKEFKKQYPDANDGHYRFFLLGEDYAKRNIDIEDVWDNLSGWDKRDFINDKADELNADGYDDIYEAWDALQPAAQLAFICGKLKEFYTWEIARELRDDKWIKDLYNEI